MYKQKKIQNWSRIGAIETNVFAAASKSELIEALNQPSVIARGNGRSYSDVAQQPSHVLDMSQWKSIPQLDEANKTVRCSAGMTIRELNIFLSSKRLRLPVVPGTADITIGGAIACDVHGKNHVSKGCFGHHVKAIRFLDAEGKITTCFPGEDLFHATVGGVGLTGIMISAELQLVDCDSNEMIVKREKLSTFQSLIDRMKLGEKEFRAAWIKDRDQILYTEAEFSGKWIEETQKRGRLGFGFFGLGTNPWILKNFDDRTYKAAKEEEFKQVADDFLYPLDRWSDWNRLYPKGFYQLQFVVDEEHLLTALDLAYTCFEKLKIRPFLATLKRFGEMPPAGWMSFVKNGFCYTVDLRYKQGMEGPLKELMTEITELGGRWYFAKDLLMDGSHLQHYPNTDRFKAFIQELNNGKFASSFSERVNLTS